jgi:hypothetical protein
MDRRNRRATRRRAGRTTARAHLPWFSGLGPATAGQGAERRGPGPRRRHRHEPAGERPGCSSAARSADFDCALGRVHRERRPAGQRAAGRVGHRRTLLARFTQHRRHSPYGSGACTGNPPGIYVPLATAIWTRTTRSPCCRGGRTRRWPTARASWRRPRPTRATATCSWARASARPSSRRLGPEVTPQQVFQAAEARFTEAITAPRLRTTPTCGSGAAGPGPGAAQPRQRPWCGADARALLAASPQYVKTGTASIGILHGAGTASPTSSSAAASRSTCRIGG